MDNTHHIERRITLYMTKLYTNGATYALFCCDGLAEARRAKIDAEDAEAGFIGTWNIEVMTVH